MNYWYDMDATQRNHAQRKKTCTRVHAVWLLLYEILEQAKLMFGGKKLETAFYGG